MGHGMPDTSPFTRVAPYYEELMRSVPYGMWLSYLKLIWTRAGLQPSKVLEVACGTGTMCRALAREGVEVVGVDRSGEMILEAERLSAGLAIRYSAQDASEFSLFEEFEAAFCFFDSLNNILDSERFSAALSRVYGHLCPGGLFLFDMNTAYAFEQKMFDQTQPDSDSPVQYSWVGDWEPNSRICTITMDFRTPEGSFQEIHRQRAYPIEQVRSAMEQAGFEQIEFFDAYTLNPTRPKSDRIHVAGIRPRS